MQAAWKNFFNAVKSNSNDAGQSTVAKLLSHNDELFRAFAYSDADAMTTVLKKIQPILDELVPNVTNSLLQRVVNDTNTETKNAVDQKPLNYGPFDDTFDTMIPNLEYAIKSYKKAWNWYFKKFDSTC